MLIGWVDVPPVSEPVKADHDSDIEFLVVDVNVNSPGLVGSIPE